MTDAASSEFRVEQDRRDGVVVISLHGDLDLASADAVHHRLETLYAAGETTRLDLDGLAFMDSSGLRVVLQAVERSSEGGWRFTISAGSEQVRRLFASAGVADRLPIEPAP
jgi:anti-anti-sigma factor